MSAGEPVLPSVPARLLLGTREGILSLRLTPEGWDAGEVLWRDRPISALAVDPAAPERIHATVFDDGIYRSEDAGRTWERYLWAGLHTLVVRPDRPELVYAGGEPPEVYRSTDGGSYWTPMQLTGHYQGTHPPAPPAWRRVRALAFDPRTPATVYAAIEGTGVVATFDGGREWLELAARGLPADVQALLVSPAAPEVLWAGTATGLYRSDDGGCHWVDAGVGVADRNVLAIAAVGDALLAAGHPQPLADWWDRPPGRLYRRGGSAARWWPVTEPLDGAVYALAATADRPVVFAGTTGGSVVWSRDGGASWATLARGLPPIRCLAVA